MRRRPRQDAVPGGGTQLPAHSLTPRRPPARPEGAASAGSKLLIALLAPLLFMLMTVPTGYLVESPGPSFDLQEGLTVNGAETYTSGGELLLTAVSLRESRLLYHLLGLFSDDFELIRVRDYLGEEMDAQGQDIVDIVITLLSQDTAVVAGLRELGLPAEVREEGMFVASVVPGYPAHGEIKRGEVIIAVNGEPVGEAERFMALIGSTPEGEAVTLQVRRIDEEYAASAYEEVREGSAARPDLNRLLEEGSREVRLQPAYEPRLGRSIIGVSVRELFTYTSGVEVKWDLEAVKGPSAGLMMTLSLVNALTPDDLTGGTIIAGTGEISLSGDVGPIGGLPFKIRAAESEGACIFIYPAENQDDLKGLSTTLRLYPVDDLTGALDLLRALP